MLPTGHFAAGYLTTRATISALLSAYPGVIQPKFWIVGLVAAIIPDIDEFLVFYKLKRFTGDKKVIHRKFITHAPLLHLTIGLLVLLIATITGSIDFKYYAVFYIVGTWTHFFFDSFGYGIMWLWPLSTRLYSFRRTGEDFPIKEKSFSGYWTSFLKFYTKDFVFFLEIFVITTALLVYF